MSNAAQNFMKDNAGTSYPGVKFRNVGDVFVGVIVDEPKVVATKPIGAKAEDGERDNLVVAMCPTPEQHAKCTVVYAETDAAGNSVDRPLVLGETYSVWLAPRNNRTRAVGEAVAAAEGNPKGNVTPQEGGVLALQFTGNGVSKTVGFSPPKLFAAQYRAPEPKTAVIAAASLI